jgi:hypothetical protein
MANVVLHRLDRTWQEHHSRLGFLVRHKQTYPEFRISPVKINAENRIMPSSGETVGVWPGQVAWAFGRARHNPVRLGEACFFVG